MSGEIETPKTEYIRKSDARLDMFGLQLDYIKQAVDSTKKVMNEFIEKHDKKEESTFKCLTDHETKLKNNLFQTKLQWWAIVIILACIGTGILIIINIKTGINIGR